MRGRRSPDSGSSGALTCLSLTLVTWVFFFLYGPVEVALPVYVAVDLQASAGLLGALLDVVRRRRPGGDPDHRHHPRPQHAPDDAAHRCRLGGCLLPFAFAPIPVTLVAFAIGGLIYGPFIPLTYALFQSSTTAANLPFVLAARSAVVMVSTPLGTAIGGPLVGSLGASATLALSGVATLLLAAAASVLWTGQESRSDPSGIEKRPPSGGE